MKSSEKKFGLGTEYRSGSRGRPRRVLLQARALGIAGSVEALCLALEAMLGGYDQAMRTLPKDSPYRALVEGAFGRVPEVSRSILDEV